jgi:hypothetical protein
LLSRSVSKKAENPYENLKEKVTIAAEPEALCRLSVDDYLGPGERRFFGKGYKRADQKIWNIHIDVEKGGNGTARARASVKYPTDWSRKGKADQAPHLSSIDVLLIAGEVTEVYLTHALHLDAAQRSRIRLRRVAIKAGRTPVEEQLSDFAVEAVISPAPLTPDDPDLRVSISDCQVGALRVRCEIEHPAGDEHEGTTLYSGPDVLLGPAALRPYGHGHKTKSQTIDDLEVDVPSNKAGALLGVRIQGSEQFPSIGLESYSHQGASIIDAFVATIQLGQILLYEIDAVNRAQSNTLWMRQTVLEINGPQRVIIEPSHLAVHLEENQLLTTRDGDTWRSSDVVADFQNMTIRCSVAHQLPRTPGEENEVE